MKKKFFTLFVKVISGIAFTWGIYTYGCADGWWTGYNSVFSPEISVGKDTYIPMFYEPDALFYDGYSENAQEVYRKENIEDWQLYLGKLTTKEALEYYMYNQENNDKILQWAIQISNNQKVYLPYAMDTNNKKVKNFFKFLSIARSEESIIAPKYDYWDYEQREKATIANTKITELEKYYNALPDDDEFFKNRIWFQVVRMKFYSQTKSSAIEFFEKTQEKQLKNTLYYRALHYVAGAYKAQKKYEQSNAILAQLFHEYPLLQKSAVFEYRAMTDKKVLEIAKNMSIDNQTALWAMQGYYSDAFTAMKKIYEINPTSKHIDFLLTRYVNIIEEKVNIYADYVEKKDIKSVKEYRKKMKEKLNLSEIKWIESVAKEHQTTNPYLWQVASGYLASMNTDYPKAEYFYNKAKQETKNIQQKNQLRLLNLLNEISKIEKIDKEIENKIGDDLKWLYHSDDRNTDDTEQAMRYGYAKDWSKKYISMLYRTQDNSLFAELVYPKQGFYKDVKQSQEMEQFFLKTNKSKWEQLWQDEYTFNLADIYQSRAIYLFYQNKIQQAIAEYEKIPEVSKKEYNWELDKYEIIKVNYKEEQLPANPFNGKIKDCNDCDHNAKQSVKYTSLTFLKKIKEMQDNIAQGKDVYNNALLVANAFYNTSYFGNTRAFYYNAIINEYGNDISKEHQSYLLSMQWAKEYYTIAKKAATTKEQKAKIAYMLAKVERNEFYNKEYFIGERRYHYGEGIMFKKWKGFEELKNYYSDTKYYKEVIAECGYFRSYLNSKK